MSRPHYTREQRTTAFWSRVVKSDDPDACWLWTGGFREGYGMLSWNGRMCPATHVSYELAHGEPPGDFYVLHTCDNPACCNPKHLFLGTQQDNMRDMVAKHRKAITRGVNCSWTKLTDHQIAEMRRLYAEGGITMQTLADRYLVTIGYVSKVINRSKRK